MKFAKILKQGGLLHNLKTGDITFIFEKGEFLTTPLPDYTYPATTTEIKHLIEFGYIEIIEILDEIY